MYVNIYVLYKYICICKFIHNHGLQILTWCHIHTCTYESTQKMYLQSLPEAPAGDIKWKWHLKLQRNLAKKLSIPGKQGEKNNAIEA